MLYEVITPELDGDLAEYTETILKECRRCHRITSYNVCYTKLLRPGVFAGYRDLPDKTREAFTIDGWFRTGDLGFVDADGRLHVLGRASTLMVTEGGEKVQPEEVVV